MQTSGESVGGTLSRGHDCSTLKRHQVTSSDRGREQPDRSRALFWKFGAINSHKSWGWGVGGRQKHSELCCRLFMGIFHVSSGSYLEAGLGLVSVFSLHTRVTEMTTEVI